MPVELDAHIQRALDRYTRLVGSSFEYKRSVTAKDFMSMVTDERLRYMPDKGSRLDKTLKKAESFARKFDQVMMKMKVIEISTYESSSLVLSSCKKLLRLASKHAIGIERFFTVLDESMAIIVQMSKKLTSDHCHCEGKISSVFQASLAMIVDIVVDIAASFGSNRSSAGERAVIAQFESQFKIITTRLVQLKFDFHMQLLNRWIDQSSSSTEDLLLILRGFEDFGLETCPPGYLHILIKVCLSLQPHGEDAQSLRWFRMLWASIEKHRHDCDISSEQWFEVYQEYLVVLSLHEEFHERLHLAEEFRAFVLTEFGSKHIFYLRTSVEFAKILEMDSVRYVDAVSIYEELCQCDSHGFEDRETVLALIEIAKYRLSELFEAHVELGYCAETLLIESFTSFKLKYSYSDSNVIVALTRIIDYHRKQKRRESTTAAVKVIEEYVLGLLVEERNEVVLFDIARTLAKMYRELTSVELGIKFIQIIKEQVVTGEHTIVEGHCGFSHGQLSHLDRRCFVFIHAFEMLLCGYEKDNMLDEIIRDIYTETCLYEAWSVSIRQTSRPIHVRLAAGARLVIFLESKGRNSEMRKLRNEMWHMFKEFCPATIASEALWQLFELSIANANKKIVSVSLLEHLVDISLEVFKGRSYKVSLQLLQWSQVYFLQLTKTQHSRAVELAFRISETLSCHIQAEHDKAFIELQRISSEILMEVFKVGHLEIDFGTIPIAQLNVMIRLLGERKNFIMLEHILQYLWDTRMSRNWNGSVTVATGKRLCEVKFAAGHRSAAINLVESICYNLRDVYGSLHQHTVECETLRASFHNTCGNHRAARDIHVHLLEQVGSMDRDDIGEHDHLADMVLDQARRLKWAYHQKGEDDRDESFYSSLLMNAQSSLHGVGARDRTDLREVLTLSGEKRETKWKHPEDWSLPLEGIE